MVVDFPLKMLLPSVQPIKFTYIKMQLYKSWAHTPPNINQVYIRWQLYPLKTFVDKISVHQKECLVRL